jgi:hypothetical protein
MCTGAQPCGGIQARKGTLQREGEGYEDQPERHQRAIEDARRAGIVTQAAEAHVCKPVGIRGMGDGQPTADHTHQEHACHPGPWRTGRCHPPYRARPRPEGGRWWLDLHVGMSSEAHGEGDRKKVRLRQWKVAESGW